MSKLLEQINTEQRTPLVLSDYIKIKHGFAFKGEFFSTQPTHDILVTPGNFAIGGGFKADKFKYYEGAVPEDYILKANDLVVTMTDLSVDADTLGYPALVPFDSKNRFLHNQRVGLVVKKKEGIDFGYLYYLMRTREYQKYVVSTASGSTVKHTSPDRIAGYECDFPTLPTQKKIAGILGAYDAKIENNNKIIKNLETITQTIFNEWFINFRFPNYENIKMIDSEIGEIPEGWKLGGIDNVVTRLPTQSTYKVDSLFSKGLIPVYDQSSKGTIGFHDEEASFIADIDNPILIFGDHTCRTQVICEPFSLGPNTVPLGEKNGYSPLFSYFLTKNVIEQREYKRHWSELSSIEFVIPPVELAKTFESKVKSFISEMIEIEKENILLKESRDQLLTKLI